MTASGTAAPAGWSVDSLTATAGSGTNPGTPILTGTVSSSVTVTAGSGTAIAGGNYNFGVAGVGMASDRALGSLATSGKQRDTYVTLTNNSGSILSNFSVSYDGEEWRLGANPSARGALTMQYSSDASSWVNMGDGFNFYSPVTSGTVGPLDGNAAANRIANIGGLYHLDAPIADGVTFYLRWADPDDGGNDDALAIDNFKITVVPESSTGLAGALFVGVVGCKLLRRKR